MRFYLLSDNLDALLGMRLSGVDGTLVKTAAELKDKLGDVLRDDEIAVILLTRKAVDMCKDYVLDLKLRLKKPLIVEIPSGPDVSESGRSLAEFIHRTTGVSVSFS